MANTELIQGSGIPFTVTRLTLFLTALGQSFPARESLRLQASPLCKAATHPQMLPHIFCTKPCHFRFCLNYKYTTDLPFCVCVHIYFNRPSGIFTPIAKI